MTMRKLLVPLTLVAMLVLLANIAAARHNSSAEPTTLIEVNGIERLVSQGDILIKGDLGFDGSCDIEASEIHIYVIMTDAYAYGRVVVALDESTCNLIVDEVLHIESDYFSEPPAVAWLPFSPRTASAFSGSWRVNSRSEMWGYDGGIFGHWLTRTGNQLNYQSDGSQVTVAFVSVQNCHRNDLATWWSIVSCHSFNDTDTPSSGVEASQTGTFKCSPPVCSSTDWDHWHSSTSWATASNWGYGCSASQTSFPPNPNLDGHSLAFVCDGWRLIW